MPLSKYMQQRGLVSPPSKMAGGLNSPTAPERKGKSLRDAVSELNIESKTNRTRMASAEVDVSKLIASQLLKDVDIKVSLYDGAATELVEDYEKYKEYESQQESETERIRDEIEKRETELPNIIKQKEQSLRDEASALLNQATNALHELQSDMENKIKNDEERIQDEIDTTRSAYQQSYDETLKEAEGGLKEIYDIMKSLNINAVNTKDFVDTTPSIEELIDLAKTDAEMIKAIRDSGGSTEVFQELAKIRDSKISSSIYLPATVVALPALAGYTVLNMAKNFIDLSIGKRYIKELEKEIQLCFKLAVQQINEFKTSYCMPDVSELEEQLKNVKFLTENSYKDSIRRAEEEVEKAKAEKKKKEDGIAGILQAERTRLEEENINFKKESEQLIKDLRDNCKRYRVSWEEKRCRFEENQTLPDFEDRTMLDMLYELCPSKFVDRDRLVNPTEIDKLRLYNELDVLNGLTYQDHPASESEEDILRYNYDQELLEGKKAIEKKIEELQANGEDKETVAKKVESLKRGLDKYYAPKFKGLHSGNHVLQQSVIDALDNGQEYFKNNMDNTSFLFVYDRTKEGDEEYLANYIKYEIQQILANYHPDALKVNIINPTYGSAFDNLQVFLDKIDKDTGAPIPGRDFCKSFTSEQKINEVAKEIADNASRKSESADAKYSYEELVYVRRSKGAVTPQYNINIIYNSLGDKLRVFNKSAESLGIINIYLLEKTSVLEYDPDKGTYKVDSNIAKMLPDIGIIGESVYKDDDKLIYLTNIKSKQITRFIYEPRSKEEENRISEIIKDKALAVKKPVTVTEEFLNSIPSVKENGYWSEDATKICKIYFGYVDGDESKPYPLILNEDDQVHMFIGGTTGGGKSNLLAVMVNCLKMMYPPSQLEIIYFDFKVVEVAIHAKPYKMPHCSAMSGTSAPEYLISLFSYCTKEMMRRYDLFKKWNVVKLSNLIKVMKAKAKSLREEGKEDEAKRVEAEIPKRLVIIIDEAAQAFQLDDSNAVERVKITLIKLAQLARAAGVHMILVSQDPNKMPNEVLTLLKLRGCTKADISISKAILHDSDISARAENQFIGFFATSTNKGEQFKNRYVVPLNDEETTRKFSKIASDKAKEDIDRNAVTFDENEPYTIKKHNYYLKTQKEAGIEVFNGTNILLGEPVYFLQKFKPHEIRLTRAEKQNIGVASGENSTKEALFKTIVNCVEPFADFIPVYCKAPPSYAPPEYFIEKAKRDNTLDMFTMFVGRNAIDDDAMERYIAELGDPELVEQFWAGDLRTKAEDLELEEKYEKDLKEYNKEHDAFLAKVEKDRAAWNKEHPTETFVEPTWDKKPPEFKGNSWQVDFLSIMQDMYLYRRREKIFKPLYMFVFDMEQHDAVIDRDLKWPEFAKIINSCNTTNMHMIYFSDGVDIADRNICRYVIAGNLPSSVTEKQFKNINVLYCKAADTLNDANSALFKPIIY